MNDIIDTAKGECTMLPDESKAPEQAHAPTAKREMSVEEYSEMLKAILDALADGSDPEVAAIIEEGKKEMDELVAEWDKKSTAANTKPSEE